MKVPFTIITASLGILTILLLTTDPKQIPAFMLVVPFILLFAILFTSILTIFERYGLPFKSAVRTAVLCTTPPILLLVMQSIGQLTVRDVLTVGALFLISYFYISRTSSKV